MIQFKSLMLSATSGCSVQLIVVSLFSGFVKTWRLCYWIGFAAGHMRGLRSAVEDGDVHLMLFKMIHGSYMAGISYVFFLTLLTIYMIQINQKYCTIIIIIKRELELQE